VKCPACKNELKENFFNDVPIDFCKYCKGAWFDDGELNSIIDTLAKMNNTPNATIELEKDIVSKYHIHEENRLCPHCKTEMKKLNYAYDSNIIVDKCETCNGIWTDNDEMMRLAVFRKGNPALDRMGEAIAKNRGEVLNKRYNDESSSNYHNSTGAWFRGTGLRIILPLSDNQERSTFPFIVVAIIAINIIVFILQLIFFKNDALLQFYNQFGLIPSSAFTSIQGGYSFITSMFLHGSMIHLFGNMLFLWIFGDNIEDRFGHVKFIIIYLFCGIFADIIYVAFNGGSTIPCIGASGAISGIMGAYFLLYPLAKIKTLIYGAIVDIPAWTYIGVWLGFQITFAYVERNRIGGGIGWMAHIGGFAAGIIIVLFAKYLNKEKENTPSYQDIDEIDYSKEYD